MGKFQKTRHYFYYSKQYCNHSSYYAKCTYKVIFKFLHTFARYSSGHDGNQINKLLDELPIQHKRIFICYFRNYKFL